MGTESTFAFSHGNTYPAVAVPWGMNFWSPQTGENGSGWMYMYTESGFMPECASPGHRGCMSNLYYPEHGFMWTKNAKGEWRDNFDATEWGAPFTEGSSWHWTWSVFHDPEGLS